MQKGGEEEDPILQRQTRKSALGISAGKQRNREQLFNMFLCKPGGEGGDGRPCVNADDCCTVAAADAVRGGNERTIKSGRKRKTSNNRFAYTTED